MKLIFRRLSTLVHSSHYHPLHPPLPRGKNFTAAAAAAPPVAGKNWIWRRPVPVVHVPMCVGEEMERFYVRAELLGRPAFVELLRRSAQEHGYDQADVLHIPCSVTLFRRLLLLDFDGAGADTTLDGIFRSLSDDIRPCTMSQ